MTLKRGFDLIVAAGGLLFLLPLLVVLALWIRLDSPGPVFFRQSRVGRNGRQFQVNKFRTMVSEANGPAITARGDDRITRAGRILRQSKLDELPQLWNVLVGDMSLVGPRPEVPEYVSAYTQAQRDKILSVRPGITDLASIEFVDEAELLSTAEDPERLYIESIIPRKIELYERYVDDRSFVLDLRILLATAGAVWSPGRKSRTRRCDDSST